MSSLSFSCSSSLVCFSVLLSVSCPLLKFLCLSLTLTHSVCLSHSSPFCLSLSRTDGSRPTLLVLLSRPWFQVYSWSGRISFFTWRFGDMEFCAFWVIESCGFLRAFCARVPGRVRGLVARAGGPGPWPTPPHQVDARGWCSCRRNGVRTRRAALVVVS